jgi:hypothetical protein
MGDNITQPATSAEHARAKFLREALQRRTLAYSGQAETVIATNVTATGEAITPSFEFDSSN